MVNFDRLFGGTRALCIFLELVAVTNMIIQLETSDNLNLNYRSPELYGSVCSILTCGCAWFVSVESYDGKIALTKSMLLVRVQQGLPVSSLRPDDAVNSFQRLCGGVRCFWLFISLYAVTKVGLYMTTTEKFWLHLAFYTGVFALGTCGVGYMNSLLMYDMKERLAERLERCKNRLSPLQLDCLIFGGPHILVSLRMT